MLSWKRRRLWGERRGQASRGDVRGSIGAHLIAPALSVAQRIDALRDAGVQEALASVDRVTRRTARAFEQTRRRPREIEVNFAGGITQRCWSVSSGDGTYRVVFLPTAGYFSLCVESDFGPLDIGVHGPALGCFGSV
jgi:hypothetical protein